MRLQLVTSHEISLNMSTPFDSVNGYGLSTKIHYKSAAGLYILFTVDVNFLIRRCGDWACT